MATVTTRAGRCSRSDRIQGAAAKAPVRARRITEVADDQQLAQVAVAHLGDATKTVPATGRVLAWDQAQEGGEFMARSEDRRIDERRRQAVAVMKPTPGMVARRRLSRSWQCQIISSRSWIWASRAPS
jgi:hypothetical protein